jgi:hypothetical protein
LTIAHVAPIALGGKTVKGFSLRQQGGEQVPAKIEGLSGGNGVHSPAGEQINTGIDRIGKHLTPAGLFDKPLDPPILASEHQTVFQRLRVAVEQQGGGGLPGGVELHGGLQIQITHGISADDKEILLPQEVHALPDTPGGAQGFRFCKVSQVYTQILTAAKIVGDAPGHILEGDGNLHNPAAAEQAEDVLQNGLVKEGSHRLGLAQAQGPQADALASG